MEANNSPLCDTLTFMEICPAPDRTPKSPDLLRKGGLDAVWRGPRRVQWHPWACAAWMEPQDAHWVDSTPGCLQCGRSLQDSGGVDSALEVHGVDGVPEHRQCRQCPGCAWSGRSPRTQVVYLVKTKTLYLLNTNSLVFPTSSPRQPPFCFLCDSVSYKENHIVFVFLKLAYFTSMLSLSSIHVVA